MQSVVSCKAFVAACAAPFSLAPDHQGGLITPAGVCERWLAVWCRTRKLQENVAKKLLHHAPNSATAKEHAQQHHHHVSFSPRKNEEMGCAVSSEGSAGKYQRRETPAARCAWTGAELPPRRPPPENTRGRRQSLLADSVRLESYLAMMRDVGAISQHELNDELSSSRRMHESQGADDIADDESRDDSSAQSPSVRTSSSGSYVARVTSHSGLTISTRTAASDAAGSMGSPEAAGTPMRLDGSEARAFERKVSFSDVRQVVEPPALFSPGYDPAVTALPPLVPQDADDDAEEPAPSPKAAAS